jgi:hypothetical protein
VKFNLTAFIVTVTAVIISGVVSFIEGNFTSKNVTMGFVNHGGMWGDLIIMSVVTGLVFPYLIKNQIYTLSALFVALTVAIIAHILWAKGMQSEAVTGHMFPTHKTGKWYLDMSGAGWMHVLVMAMLLAVFFIYAISPLPKNVVITASLLLTIHVFIAAVQPGWYCTRELWTRRNFGPPLVVTALVWSIAALKIQLAKGNS